MRRVREGHVRVAGQSVFFRDVGDGDPVLLINGLGAHTPMWGPLEDALKDLRVIEFDAPGTGRSSTPALPIGVPAVAHIASAVLDHVGVLRADVLGYSMGGFVAQQFAARYPDRVRRLVLVATGCGWGSVPGRLPQLLNLATPLRYWSSAWYDATMGGLVGGRARRDPEWVSSLRRRRNERPPSTLGYLGQLTSIGAFSSLPLLPHIHHPTLVVTGDDDPLVPPANASVLASRLPNARMVVAADEGHLLLMDDESAAHGAIVDFLTAETLSDAKAWTAAVEVSPADARRAVASTRRQAQPVGKLGAVARALHPDVRST